MIEIEEAIVTLQDRYMTMSMCLSVEEWKKQNDTIDLAINALEKQIAKKAEYHHKANGECSLTICPNCESRLTVTRYAFPLDRYCKQCGQRYIVNILNWEAEE